MTIRQAQINPVSRKCFAVSELNTDLPSPFIITLEDDNFNPLGMIYDLVNKTWSPDPLDNN